MIKELVRDEAILSQPCEIATAADADVAQDLIDTIRANEDTACLAANQIGVTKAVIAIVDDDETVRALFNPKILLGLNAAKTIEGCLTRDGETKVTRYAKIKVSFEELVDGELKPRKEDFCDWTAQMIQHMVDHCKGKLV